MVRIDFSNVDDIYEPQRGGRKKFSRKLYDESDQPAKDAVCRYLQGMGWTIADKEKYGVDLRAYKDGPDGWPEWQEHEAEVKHGWKGDWPSNWDDVRIPERKMRLVDNLTCPLFFWVLSDDLSQAWVVPFPVFEYAPKEVRPNKYMKDEKFAIIPIDKATLVVLNA